MPKYSRRRAVALVLTIVGGLVLGRYLLGEQPPEGEVVLTAELFWVPASTRPGLGRCFVKDGKTLAVRIRNGSAASAKLFDLSDHYATDRVSLRSLRSGLIVETELWDHSGRPVLVVGGSPSILPRSHFDAADVVKGTRPVYGLGPWQVGVPDRLGRHFARKPAVFEFAPGRNIDGPFDPFPMYVCSSLLEPGSYTVGALVTWLDATTQEKRQFRSQLIGFEFTADDRARRNALQEAVWSNTFNLDK